MLRLLAAILLVLSPLYAQVQTEDVAQFARRVGNALTTNSVRLVVTARDNTSTDREAFTQAIRDALRGRQVAVNADAAAEIRITLSTQTGQALWVAEIMEPEHRQAVVFRPVEPAPEGESEAPTLALVSQPFFEQEHPILDLVSAGSRLFVLGDADVTIFEGQPGQWKKVADAAIEAPASRDPRGQIWLNAGQVIAYVQGRRCEGSADGEFRMACSESAEWLRGPIPGPVATERNYFKKNGRTASGPGEFPAFFDASKIGEGADAVVAVALTDGNLALFPSGAEPLASEPLAKFSGYGSHVATIEPACGGRRLLLVSSEGDATQRDFLQALTVRGRQVQRASAPMEMPGMVVAVGGTESGTRAIAVVRDESRNRYVALYISALCGG